MIIHAKGYLLIASVIFTLAAPSTAFARSSYIWQVWVEGLATPKTKVNVRAACTPGGHSTNLKLTEEISPLIFNFEGIRGGGSCAVGAAPVPPHYTQSVSDQCIVPVTEEWGIHNLKCYLKFSLAEADLSITKTDGVTAAVAGETTLNYTIVVAYDGPGEVTDAAVTDTFPPAQLEQCSWTSVAAGGASGNTASGDGDLAETGLTLPSGGSITYSVGCGVRSDAPVGAISNTATVASAALPDPDPSNNSATDDDTIVSHVSDLSIVKADSVDSVIAGTNLTYKITVDNHGPSDAANTTIVDTLPPGTTFVPAPGCTADTSDPVKVTCTFDIVEAKTSVTFDLVVHVAPTVAHGAKITNKAIVSSDSADPDDTNNTASEVTTVNREATFDIAKIWADQGAGEVEVTLTCSNGTVTAPTSTPASMTVTGFADGTTCTVTEAVPVGYAPTYSAECKVTPVVSGSTYSCEITNAETVARFHVTKDFSDGSTDDVDVTLTCNTGLPLTQSLTIAGGDPVGVTFVVTDYIDGTMSCAVTEVSNTPGYDPDTTACKWNNLMTADSPFSCVINNTAQDATFNAWMEWNIFNEGGDEVDEDVLVTITCASKITYTSGISSECGLDCWKATDVLGDGDYLEVDVSTLLGDASCTATQASLPSGVEPGGNCGGSHTLLAGESDSCTFTNTVFFEGIPTLSQYGLALLALLMLGVGMVGFRRFA